MIVRREYEVTIDDSTLEDLEKEYGTNGVIDAVTRYCDMGYAYGDLWLITGKGVVNEWLIRSDLPDGINLNVDLSTGEFEDLFRVLYGPVRYEVRDLGFTTE